MSQQGWNRLAAEFEDSVCDITATSGAAMARLVKLAEAQSPANAGRCWLRHRHVCRAIRPCVWQDRGVRLCGGDGETGAETLWRIHARRMACAAIGEGRREIWIDCRPRGLLECDHLSQRQLATATMGKPRPACATRWPVAGGRTRP